jgi:hypothetical protein
MLTREIFLCSDYRRTEIASILSLKNLVSGEQVSLDFEGLKNAL